MPQHFHTSQPDSTVEKETSQINSATKERPKGENSNPDNWDEDSLDKKAYKYHLNIIGGGGLMGDTLHNVDPWSYWSS